MNFSSLLRLLLVAALLLLATPALAQMTAEQHYDRGLKENADAKYLEAIADHDEAIKIKPDYWKAYANRASAEYNAKRYQAALQDINTAMEHLPPMKGLTDLKATIEQALHPAVSSADMQRRIIALQALQRLSAIQSGAAYPGEFYGPAYNITQLANTLTSRGYKIPSNLVHPNTVSLIHPNGEPSSTTSQSAGSQSEVSANDAKLASMVGANATTPLPATQKKSGTTPKLSITKNTGPQTQVSPSEAKLAALAGSSPTKFQPPAPEVSAPPPNYLEQGTEKTRSGDWAGAIADFDECIKQDPNNFVGYADRGAAKLQTGDTQGAIVDLDRAVELMPDNPQTRDFRDKLKAAIEQAKSLSVSH